MGSRGLVAERRKNYGVALHCWLQKPALKVPKREIYMLYSGTLNNTGDSVAVLAQNQASCW